MITIFVNYTVNLHPICLRICRLENARFAVLVLQKWNNILSGVTLYQGAPGSKFSKAPLVEVLKARVEHRICTSFLGGPGHVHPENF